MAEMLPRFVVLKSEGIADVILGSEGYAYFMNASDSERGYVSCSEKSVFEPYAKIEVERAKINSKYVHLRFCAANKYWARSDSWILANSDQPEEDVSVPSCTLFEPVYENTLINFIHVPSGGKVAKDLTTSRLLVVNFSYNFSFVDWETLVKLPNRVALKGYNDKYVRDFWQDSHGYLQVSSKDGNQDITSYEVHLHPDGHLRFKSEHYNKFWRRDPNWIWSDSTDVNGQSKDTLFWPVKVDDSTVALRNAGNDKFIIPVSKEFKENCLNADVLTITKEARYVVEELVLDRSVYNVRYRMEDSRIYDETPFLAGVGSARNNNDKESSMTVAVKFEERTSFSFTNSFSVTLGVSTEITCGIPFIAESTIEISAEVTNALEWNRTTEETKSVEASYTVTVPPKSTVQVSYVGTKGKCNVPYSYTQRDKSSTDGQIVRTEHIDGIFNGVSCYNYQFEQPAFFPL